MIRSHFHLAFLSAASTCLLQLTTVRPAAAQATAELPHRADPSIATVEPAGPPQAAPVTPEAPTAGTVAGATAPAAAPDRLTALEEKLEAQNTRIEELEGTVSTLGEQLSASEGASEDRLLSGWGFTDITFGRAILDNNRGAYGNYVPRKWSFMSNGVNLYLKSEMGRTLSAMVETRLTYTPVGSEFERPTNVYIDGNLLQSQGTYRRGYGDVKGPLSFLYYRQHGVVIERAHVDWKPADWFGLRLGRYLTPYGIWNEDHGSPVTLGVDMPNLINYALVPTQQTGLEIYGSRVLAENLTLDYAITLSNGRGPIDEYKDLDNNKAVGLRGKLVYNTDDLLLRVGGYGYYGRYSDSIGQLELYLTPSLTLDTNRDGPLGSSHPMTESYREAIGAFEAMVQFKGLKLMGELAQRKVVYDIAPPLEADESLLSGVPFGTEIYAASFIGIAYYVMVGYEFDLGASLGNIKLTPYLGADHLAPDETQPSQNMNQYRFGLNVKPNPYITCKAELVRVVPEADELVSKLWAPVAQVAVSF